MTPYNSRDLSVRPMTTSIPQDVPKQVANKIMWDLVKVVNSFTLPSTGLVENNIYCTLTTHPQYASWAALFDQWCIPQFSIRFESLLPAGSTFAPAVLITALDFDNATNLGTTQALLDFSTAAETVMSCGKVFTRSVRPCVKPQLGATASSGVGRFWCDCGVPTTPWYGIRIIGGSAGTAYIISYTVSVWFAFRNQI